MSYFSRLNETLKLTANHYPEMFITFGYLFAGMGFAVYNWHTIKTTHRWVARHKSTYTIMRPDDERLLLLPKTHVTERHLLPSDHPETIQDRKFHRLPPIKDPYITNDDVRR